MAELEDQLKLAVEAWLDAGRKRDYADKEAGKALAREAVAREEMVRLYRLTAEREEDAKT